MSEKTEPLLKRSGRKRPASPASRPTISRSAAADEHLGAGRGEWVVGQADALGEVRADSPARRRHHEHEHAAHVDRAVDATWHDQHGHAGKADHNAEHGAERNTLT